MLSFFAVFAGFLNFPHFDKFEKWFQPRFPVGFAEILHPVAFNPIIATVSVLVAGSGIGIAWAYYQGKLPQGLSERNALAHAGKAGARQ